MVDRILIVVCCCSLFLSGCSQDSSEMDEAILYETGTYTSGSDSYLPMAIGNYWRQDDGNYTSITDTLRIGDELFYKFESLIGHDAYLTQYLHLDENNDLIELWNTDPDQMYLHAKFGSKVGTKFHTLDDGTVNDYEVTLKSRDNNVIEFEFNMVYHPLLKGHTHSVTYKKGLGIPVGRRSRSRTQYIDLIKERANCKKSIKIPKGL